MSERTSPAEVLEVEGGRARRRDDEVAVEAPLEIRLRVGPTERAVSLTLRTPGDDEELAVGFLHAEGIVRGRAEVRAVSSDGERVTIELPPDRADALARATRAFTTTSACGLCGKDSLEAMRIAPAAPLPPGPRLSAALVHELPAALRRGQAAFATTGGTHAAGLFDGTGRLRLAREDVGRHNAVDKLVGRLLLDDALPPGEAVLAVSGRASYELVQKTVAAGIPVLAAVGAPSSLAVALATEAGLTLLGFVRDGRFNVYTGAQRIAHDA